MILIQSTGAIPLGPTGIVVPSASSFFVDVNGFPVITGSIYPQQRVTITSAGESITIWSIVGCCVYITATGPLTLGQTGVFGGSNVEVRVNGACLVRVPTLC